MQFTEQTFSIAVTNRLTGVTTRHEVMGMIAEDKGLGYHVEEGEHYFPTHLESGFGLGPYFFYEQDVQEWLAAIADLTDWHQPAALFFDGAYEREVVPQMRAALHRITSDYGLVSPELGAVAREREKSCSKP